MMLLLMSMGRSNPVTWEKVAEGYMSGVMEEKAVWWDSTYAELVPEGDSTTLLIFLGQRPTGGYGVDVEKVEIKGGKLVVVARERCPKPGSMVIQVITSPFVAVKVDVPERLPVALDIKRCGKK